MAVFDTTFFSGALHRHTSLTLILPLEKNNGLPPELQSDDTPLRPVMLLHGFSGTHSDWLYGSRIQELALRYHLAVVCPSGENSFYLDDTRRDALYAQHLCEVMDFLQSVFPVSKKREDVTIGGLSMGGYGALRNGLAFPERFGNIIALSSALITDKLAAETEQKDNPMASAAYYEHIFGKPADIPGSARDPKFLAKRLAEAGGPLPRIVMACGTEDFLFDANNDMSAYLTRIGVAHTYLIGPGIHNWTFWDAYVEKALELLYGKA